MAKAVNVFMQEVNRRKMRRFGRMVKINYAQPGHKIWNGEFTLGFWAPTNTLIRHRGYRKVIDRGFEPNTDIGIYEVRSNSKPKRRRRQLVGRKR